MGAAPSLPMTPSGPERRTAVRGRRSLNPCSSRPPSAGRTSASSGSRPNSRRARRWRSRSQQRSSSTLIVAKRVALGVGHLALGVELLLLGHQLLDVIEDVLVRRVQSHDDLLGELTQCHQRQVGEAPVRAAGRRPQARAGRCGNTGQCVARGMVAASSAATSIDVEAPRAGERRLRRLLEAAQVDHEIVGRHRCRRDEGHEPSRARGCRQSRSRRRRGAWHRR